MNRNRVVVYLLRQQQAGPPLNWTDELPGASQPRESADSVTSKLSLIRRIGRTMVAGLISAAILVTGWGCASGPRRRAPDDPFAQYPPGQNPQYRARPMTPSTPWPMAPQQQNPPPRQPAPTPRTPQQNSPTPQETPPKTFSDSPTWPAIPPTRRQPVETDVDPLPESRDADKSPSDGPTLLPPAIGPQASRPTSYFDRSKAAAGQLQLTVEAPERRPLGSGAPFQLTVKNPTGTRVQNVQVICEFGDGLAFPGSSSKTVTHKIPRIDAGDARTCSLTLTSETPGRHECRFRVNINDQTVVQKTATVEFVSRQLDWQLQGPAVRSVGSRAEFNIPLVNVSETELQDVRVQVDLDAALTVREMTRGGQLSDRRVTWTIPRLAAGEGLLLQLEVECRQATTQACLMATVSGAGLPPDNTEACLTVKPVAGSLEVQIQDTADPVSEGETTEFVVTVTNRGLQSLKGIALNCKWPESFEFVRMEAREENHVRSLSPQVSGSQATLSSAALLPTDKSFEYRLILRAGRVGAHQVTVSAGDGTDQPAVEVSEPILVHR